MTIPADRPIFQGEIATYLFAIIAWSLYQKAIGAQSEIFKETSRLSNKLPATEEYSY